jgi:hypothetical protein
MDVGPVQRERWHHHSLHTHAQDTQVQKRLASYADPNPAFQANADPDPSF